MKALVQFADIRRVVTFCKAGWYGAREHGVPQTAVLRTFAPVFFNFSEAQVDPFTFDGGNPTSPHNFGKELQGTCRQIDRALRTDSLLIDRIPAVISIVTRQQNLLRFANTLCAEDLNEPVALVTPVLRNGQLADHFLEKLSPLFADHPACRRIHVEAGQASSIATPEINWAGRLESLHDRIGFDPLRVLMWPLLSKFGSTSLIFRRGQVGFLTDDNPLIRETALSLARRGYAARRLPKFEGTPIEDPFSERMRELLTPHLSQFIKAWAPDQLWNVVLEENLATINYEIPHYLSALIRWRTFFSDDSKNWAGVLANLAKNSEQYALFQVCRERNLFFATFQHGLSREICTYPRYSSSTHEMTASTHFFCYNGICADIARRGTAAHGKAIPIGAPQEILRAGHHRRPTRALPPIFYASTNLYSALTSAIRGTDSDVDMARVEHDIITKVLALLQHRVLYKPYPYAENRFLDPDPCLMAATCTANIEVYKGQKDLSLLLPDARLIITARATSTLGWCMATRRPVVLINMPNSAPLLPELSDIFAKGIFLFDTSKPDFHRQLRGFLDRPLEEIEQEHASTKIEGRDYLLKKYYESAQDGTGRRAADVLEAHMVRPDTR